MFKGLLIIAVLSALAFVVHRRGFAGYKRAPAGLAVLNQGEAAFVESVAEVMFPPSAGLAMSGLDAGLPHYIDRHLAALPRSKRMQIRLLFAVVEHVTLFVPGDEPEGHARFSSLSAAARIDLLRRLANHQQGQLRLVVTALRSVFVLGYLGHPANLTSIGLAPFEIEPVVSEAELLFPRIGGLPSSIPYEASEQSDASVEPLPPLDPNGARHPAYSRSGALTRGLR